MNESDDYQETLSTVKAMGRLLIVVVILATMVAYFVWAKHEIGPASVGAVNHQSLPSTAVH